MSQALGYEGPDPPLFGPELDECYDKEIGQNMRMAWMKVNPAAETLKKLGILD